MRRGVIELAIKKISESTFVGIVCLNGEDILRTEKQFTDSKECQMHTVDLLLNGSHELMDSKEGQRFLKTLKDWKVENEL